MSPWQLNDVKAESVTSRQFRYLLAAVLLGAGMISLFISPMSWPLFLIYMCLGLVVGVLQTRDQVAGILALVILVFGVEAGPSWLSRIAPEWYAAWWQPGLVALAAAGLVHLTPLVVRRFPVGLIPRTRDQSVKSRRKGGVR